MSFYDGKRVLVTGGAGFVGRHLVEQLVAQGAQVSVPVHTRPVPQELGPVRAIAADLTQPEDCRRVMRDIDYVFHAAGAVSGAGASGSSIIAGTVANLVLTARVLEAASQSGVERCLVLSSSTVYPAVSHAVREEEAWSGPPHPSYFAYGWMRRYLERLSETIASASSLRIALVRPTAVYGRHDNFDPATSHFVPALIRRAVERERPFEVWGTGDETRDLLHISDLARGCLLALEKHCLADPINIGYGASVSVREVVRLILDAAGYADAEVVFNPARPGTIPRRMVDCTRARELLGFTPSVTLADGLRDTVAWYRDARSAAAGRS